jgi:ABC-type multidrug transport system permease subunit
MFVLLMVTASGGESLVRDRVHGQLARLRAAPLSAAELCIGKVLARVLLGVIQAFLLLICGGFLFGIRLGNSPVYLAPVILSLGVVAGCISILVGLVCQTEKQVSHVAIFAGVFLAALGGCWWPIEYVPDVLNTVAICTPSYWAMHGLQNVMYFNKSTTVLLNECPILLAFAAGILLAVLPLRNR